MSDDDKDNQTPNNQVTSADIDSQKVQSVHNFEAVSTIRGHLRDIERIMTQGEKAADIRAALNDIPIMQASIGDTRTWDIDICHPRRPHEWCLDWLKMSLNSLDEVNDASKKVERRHNVVNIIRPNNQETRKPSSWTEVDLAKATLGNRFVNAQKKWSNYPKLANPKDGLNVNTSMFELVSAQLKEKARETDLGGLDVMAGHFSRINELKERTSQDIEQKKSERLER